jgi:hypothetical protein
MEAKMCFEFLHGLADISKCYTSLLARDKILISANPCEYSKLILAFMIYFLNNSKKLIWTLIQCYYAYACPAMYSSLCKKFKNKSILVILLWTVLEMQICNYWSKSIFWNYLRNKSWKPEWAWRIYTLRHIRIEINHGSQNVFWVLSWIGGY